MSPEANKSVVKSHCSNKISHNFKQEGVYFQICVGNLGYNCCFLSGFPVKLLIKILQIICVTSEAIAI